MDAQAVVHIRCEQRKHSAEEGPRDGVRGQDRRSEEGVRVDEVAHDAEVDEEYTEPEGGAARDAGDPVDGGRVGPREPEQADGDRDRGEHHGWQAGLGWCEPPVPLLRVLVPLVVRNGVQRCDDHADHDAEECQPADALVPAAAFLVDDGEGGEHHEQRAVYDSDVD